MLLMQAPLLKTWLCFLGPVCKSNFALAFLLPNVKREECISINNGNIYILFFMFGIYKCKVLVSNRWYFHSHFAHYAKTNPNLPLSFPTASSLDSSSSTSSVLALWPIYERSRLKIKVYLASVEPEISHLCSLSLEFLQSPEDHGDWRESI